MVTFLLLAHAGKKKQITLTSRLAFQLADAGHHDNAIKTFRLLLNDNPVAESAPDFQQAIIKSYEAVLRSGFFGRQQVLLAGFASYPRYAGTGNGRFCYRSPAVKPLRISASAPGPVIYEGTREIHKLMQADYLLGYRTDRPTRCELPPYGP